MDLGQLYEEKDLWIHDKTLRRVRFLFLPYCTEGHWVLIVFDFGPASVVVWNTVNSNEKNTCQRQPLLEIGGRSFLLNAWVSRIFSSGPTKVCSKGAKLMTWGYIYIIKIMECGSRLDFTQEYISKARLFGTYHILATQFHQELLPNISTWNL